MTDQTPRTEAGRRLAADHWDAAVACGMSRVFMDDAILAIEAEARTEALDVDNMTGYERHELYTRLRATYERDHREWLVILAGATE